MESHPDSVTISHIGTSYLQKLSNDFSIWQHSKGPEIDYSQGYALDDAARGLIAALLCNEMALATTYLQFIHHACCGFAEPVIFFDSNKKPLSKPISHDALGEAYWAVWVASKYNLSQPLITEVTSTLHPHLLSATTLRSLAYASLTHETQLVKHFHTIFKDDWQRESSKTWPWPEDTLSYANALLPLALLATTLPKSALFNQAESMLRFLNTTCAHNGLPCPIGNEGWYKRGGSKAIFVQQPIDPAYQVWANALAYTLTNTTQYKEETEQHLAWFWGLNTAHTPMVELTSERCFDGISELNISANCGAECIVCYLIAQAVYEDLFKAANKSVISTLFMPIHKSAAP